MKSATKNYPLIKAVYVITAMSLLLQLPGCGSEPIIEDVYIPGEITGYDSYHRRCGSILDSARVGARHALSWADGSYYEINQLEESNIIEGVTINFDEAVNPDGDIFTFNDTPSSIYAGAGSAHLRDSSFKAMFLGRSDELTEVSFQVYIDGEQSQSFEFKWMDLTFTCIFDSSGQNGGGGGGLGMEKTKTFTVEPNSWTEITVNVKNDGDRPLDLYLELTTEALQAGQSSEFYIDEIEFR